VIVAILILVIVVSTDICWRIARRKSLNIQLWIILGALIGPFAIPFALLAKSREVKAGP
jgi:hypothetical protein